MREMVVSLAASSDSRVTLATEEGPGGTEQLLDLALRRLGGEGSQSAEL